MCIHETLLVSQAMERPFILYAFYLKKPMFRYRCTGLHSGIFAYSSLKLSAYFFDFLLTVKAAPHECVIRTGQPQT